MTSTLRVNGVDLVAEASGALIWPEAATIVVADLHLEKGSAMARRGTLLPPYDSRATLDRLEDAIARTRARRVICLGDSFHDGDAPERLDAVEVARLVRLTRLVEWIWIIGNHDARPGGRTRDTARQAVPRAWGGRAEAVVTFGALTFRHEADRQAGPGEVSGHFHPKAAIATRARRITGRCFATDGRRLILPAFGAYAGGLDVLDPAISDLFERGFHAYLIGRATVRAFPSARLSPVW